MKNIELIIFDLDGTLVDSKKDIANAVNFTLKKLGLPEKSIEKISSYIGGGVEELIRKSLGNERTGILKKALSTFIAYYREHSTDQSRLYPNVSEVLEYFSNKRKALVTNRKVDLAADTLKTLGIRGYFENIIGGDDIGCMKPSSCPLDRTISKLNMDKNKTIIVGDMGIDVVAGKSAGIATCAVTYGIGKKEDIIKAGPDYIIDDIIKLKDIIN